MACPKCGCKTTYPSDSCFDGEPMDDYLETCAACSHVFDVEEAADEDDDEELYGEQYVREEAK